MRSPVLLVLVLLSTSMSAARAGVVAVRANLPELKAAEPRSATPAPAEVRPRAARTGRAPAAEQPARPRKYDTIGHRILDVESAVAPVAPEMYGLLDALIDEAGRTIGNEPLPGEPAAREVRARKALTESATLRWRLQRQNPRKIRQGSFATGTVVGRARRRVERYRDG